MKLKLDLVDLPKDERDYSEKLGNDSEVTKEVMTLFNDTSLYNALLDQGRKYMLVEIGNIAYENSNLKIDWMFDHSYFKLDDFSFEEAHTKIQSQYEFKMDYDFV
jgi:hypothetical protein